MTAKVPHVHAEFTVDIGLTTAMESGIPAADGGSAHGPLRIPAPSRQVPRARRSAGRADGGAGGADARARRRLSRRRCGELRGRGQAALDEARAAAEAALGDVLERRAQLVQEHRQAGEAVGVDDPGQAARAPGAVRDPRAEGRRRERRHRQHVDGPELAQALGADALVGPAGGRRDDERAAVGGERLGRRVVAAHRDDLVGHPDQRVGPGEDTDDPQVVAARGRGLEPAVRSRVHERPGEHDPGRALRHRRPGEGGRQAGAVVAAAGEADADAASPRRCSLRIARTRAVAPGSACEPSR